MLLQEPTYTTSDVEVLVAPYATAFPGGKNFVVVHADLQDPVVRRLTDKSNLHDLNLLLCALGRYRLASTCCNKLSRQFLSPSRAAVGQFHLGTLVPTIGPLPCRIEGETCLDSLLPFRVGFRAATHNSMHP